MASRDIHSNDGGRKVRDFLSSILANLLLMQNHEKPIYLISPWLSDFLVFDNDFGQFKDLFRWNSVIAENPTIRFTEVLLELSARNEIRIITSEQDDSKRFIELLDGAENIEVMIEAPMDHQKAFLSELFYFEGSMNFTYSGVYRNKEKITCNAAYTPEGKQKISEAYLEFGRSWDNLKNSRA